MIKNIPPSDMAEVRAKVAAFSALSGERVDWGYSRSWERDYLANVSFSLGCSFRILTLLSVQDFYIN